VADEEVKLPVDQDDDFLDFFDELDIESSVLNDDVDFEQFFDGLNSGAPSLIPSEIADDMTSEGRIPSEAILPQAEIDSLPPVTMPKGSSHRNHLRNTQGLRYTQLAQEAFDTQKRIAEIEGDQSRVDAMRVAGLILTPQNSPVRSDAIINFANNLGHTPVISAIFPSSPFFPAPEELNENITGKVPFARNIIEPILAATIVPAGNKILTKTKELTEEGLERFEIATRFGEAVVTTGIVSSSGFLKEAVGMAKDFEKDIDILLKGRTPEFLEDIFRGFRFLPEKIMKASDFIGIDARSTSVMEEFTEGRHEDLGFVTQRVFRPDVFEFRDDDTAFTYKIRTWIAGTTAVAMGVAGNPVDIAFLGLPILLAKVRKILPSVSRGLKGKILTKTTILSNAEEAALKTLTEFGGELKLLGETTNIKGGSPFYKMLGSQVDQVSNLLFKEGLNLSPVDLQVKLSTLIDDTKIRSSAIINQVQPPEHIANVMGNINEALVSKTSLITPDEVMRRIEQTFDPTIPSFITKSMDITPARIIDDSSIAANSTRKARESLVIESSIETTQGALGQLRALNAPIDSIPGINLIDGFLETAAARGLDISNAGVNITPNVIDDALGLIKQPGNIQSKTSFINDVVSHVFDESKATIHFLSDAVEKKRFLLGQIADRLGVDIAREQLFLKSSGLTDLDRIINEHLRAKGTVEGSVTADRISSALRGANLEHTELENIITRAINNEVNNAIASSPLLTNTEIIAEKIRLNADSGLESSSGIDNRIRELRRMQAVGATHGWLSPKGEKSKVFQGLLESVSGKSSRADLTPEELLKLTDTMNIMGPPEGTILSIPGDMEKFIKVQGDFSGLARWKPAWYVGRHNNNVRRELFRGLFTDRSIKDLRRQFNDPEGLMIQRVDDEVIVSRDLFLFDDVTGPTIKGSNDRSRQAVEDRERLITKLNNAIGDSKKKSKKGRLLRKTVPTYNISKKEMESITRLARDPVAAKKVIRESPNSREAKIIKAYRSEFDFMRTRYNNWIDSLHSSKAARAELGLELKDLKDLKLDKIRFLDFYIPQMVEKGHVRSITNISKKERRGVDFFAEHQRRSGPEARLVDDLDSLHEMWSRGAAWKQHISPLIKRKAKFGKDNFYPVEIQRWTNDYMGMVIDGDTTLNSLSGKTITLMYEKAFNGIQRASRLVGFKGLTPLEVREMARVMATATADAGVYGAFAFRPGGGVKNLTQTVTNTLPIIGVRWTTVGAARLTTSKGAEKIRSLSKSKGLLGAYLPDEVGSSSLFDLAGSGSKARKVSDFYTRLRDNSMYFFKGADYTNRSIAYLGAESKASNIMNKIISSDKPIEQQVQQMVSDLNLRLFDPVVIRDMTNLLLEGKIDQIPELYGLEVAGKTQYRYSKAEGPLINRTFGGKVFGRFTSWGVNYGLHINKMARGGVNGWAALFKWMVATHLLNEGFKAAGIDSTRWFYGSGFGGGDTEDIMNRILPIAPVLNLGPGPVVTTALEAKEALADTASDTRSILELDGSNILNKLGRLAGRSAILVAGGLEIKNIYRGLSEMVDGEFTRGAIRMFGLPKRLTEEEKLNDKRKKAREARAKARLKKETRKDLKELAEDLFGED